MGVVIFGEDVAENYLVGRLFPPWVTATVHIVYTTAPEATVGEDGSTITVQHIQSIDTVLQQRLNTEGTTIGNQIHVVNSNVTSTQAAVQDVKSVVTSGNQSLDAHLTRQDTMLNRISSQVNAIYSLVKRLVKPILTPMPTPITDPIYVFPKPVVMTPESRPVTPKT